jgi:putative FmdB family regulatory protein
MPTYEYRCKKCKHSFEEFQSMSAEPVKRCPKCGKKSVERLISAGAGIIFKGSGFYETDYKRAGETKPCEEKSKSDSGSGGSGSESSKSESGSSESCKSCEKADSCPASKPSKK